MITPGKYSVWFKTPVGEGSGVVTLHENGDLRGGDILLFRTLDSGHR